MRLKFMAGLVILNIFLLSVICTSLLRAQNKTNRLIVNSEPSGAMVYFKGENNFVGITPFRLRPKFRGVYKIITVKNGYEKRINTYLFKGNENGTLKLQLSPKTRLKAGIRSSIFPGWGQIYSERKISGMFLNFLEVGSTIGTLIAIKKYNDHADEYEDALHKFEKYKTNYELHNTYWELVKIKHKRADDSYKTMEIWIYASAGIWIYNILDSILFFPNFDNEIFHRSLPTISSNVKDGVPGLTFSFKF